MFKKIKEQIEAIEWLRNWIKTNSSKRTLAVIVILLLIIGGAFKLFFVFSSRSTGQKTITSSGQSGGITAENVTINNPLPSSREEPHDENVDYIKNKLRKLYGEISVLSDYPIPQGDIKALQDYEVRVNKWVSDTCMWIEQNIGFAAREIFLNRDEGGRTWSSDYDKRFNQLMSDLRGYKLGLKELLKSDELWYENKNEKKEMVQPQ